MFKTGDSVRFLDQPGEGTIISKEGKSYWVMLNGIEVLTPASNLVLIEFDHLLRSPSWVKDVVKIKSADSPAKPQKKPPSEIRQATYELDLHIEELIENHANMSNSEILNYQLRCCKQFLAEARKKHYKKIILIHGVGEGVLKSAIHHWLDSLDSLEYQDAPYRIYGYGATEVRLRHNH